MCELQKILGRQKPSYNHRAMYTKEKLKIDPWVYLGPLILPIAVIVFVSGYAALTAQAANYLNSVGLIMLVWIGGVVMNSYRNVKRIEEAVRLRLGRLLTVRWTPGLESGPAELRSPMYEITFRDYEGAEYSEYCSAGLFSGISFIEQIQNKSK